MTADHLFDRLRAANPAATVRSSDDGLLAAILSTPGDPRLFGARPQTAARRRRWLRIGGGQLAFIAGLMMIGTAGATVGLINIGVFSHASPRKLFGADLQGVLGGAQWRQTVISGSVHRAETLTVPGVGKYQYWIARSIQKGDCQAIRLPDGAWGAMNNDRYGFGGPVPGCLPWPCRGAMSNCLMGPGLVGGFFYNIGVLVLPRPYKWRIVYGITASRGRAVEVRDASTGVTTRVFEGHYFAMVLPIKRYEGPTTANSGYYPFIRLQALDASGRVIAQAPPDRGM